MLPPMKPALLSSLSTASETQLGHLLSNPLTGGWPSGPEHRLSAPTNTSEVITIVVHDPHQQRPH